MCSLQIADGRIEVVPIRLPALGLMGRPDVRALAAMIEQLAEQADARLVFIDGPQAWKAPENGLLHSRICERQLVTQGKTGLPGFTKPSNYGPFTRFAIDLFDQLTVLGWPRLPEASALSSSRRFALESFPTSAWRALGLAALPGKANTPAGTVAIKLAELAALSRIAVLAEGDLSHDELQALVAGLAGIGVAGHADFGFGLAGVPPFELDGTWREGFIVSPVRASVVAAEEAAERVSLDRATPAMAPLLSNLLELYMHDLSEIFPIDLEPDGRFGYDQLPLYWSEPDKRHAFLIRRGADVLGFTLATRGSPATDDPTDLDVAEFFVLRRHRRSSVGRQAAFALWGRLPGHWVVRVSEANRAGLPFWREIIRSYTGGSFTESTRPGQPNPWRVFRFTSHTPG